MISDVEKKQFIAELMGYVNGELIDVVGTGTIDVRVGHTRGIYKLRNIPKNFDPRLLSGCLITGYPNVCSSIGDRKNPFGDLEYRYSRSLDFGGNSILELETEVSYQSQMLLSKFRLQGNVKSPGLCRVSELEEVWVRRSANNIDGQFNIEWLTESGSAVSARAATNYALMGSNDCQVENSYIRTIRIECYVDDDNLYLDQMSCLK